MSFADRMSTLTSSGVALASRLGQDAIKTLLPPMIGEPVSPLAAIHLLVDLLESLERSCDELLASRYAPDPDLDGRDPDTVLLRTAGMRDFIDHLEAQELALVAKLTRARLWAELVGNSDERLARFANLFHAGSTALSELGPRLADPIEDLFATGGQQLAFLMARGIISDVRATADGSVPIQIHPHYLVCGIAPVGDIAAMVTSTLNALDAHYGLYEADAELDEDGDGAGLSLALLAQAMRVAGAVQETDIAGPAAQQPGEAAAEALALDELPEPAAGDLPDQEATAEEEPVATGEAEVSASAPARLEGVHSQETLLAPEDEVASGAVPAAAAEHETEGNPGDGEFVARETAVILDAESAIGEPITGPRDNTLQSAEDPSTEGPDLDTAALGMTEAEAASELPEPILEASEAEPAAGEAVRLDIAPGTAERDEAVLDLMSTDAVETSTLGTLGSHDAVENSAEPDEAVLELELTERSASNTGVGLAEAAVLEPVVSDVAASEAAVSPVESRDEPVEAAGDAPSSEFSGLDVLDSSPSPEGVPDVPVEADSPLLADGACAKGAAASDRINAEAGTPVDEPAPSPADEPPDENVDASGPDSILELSADNDDDLVLDLEGLDSSPAPLPENSLAQRLAALEL